MYQRCYRRRGALLALIILLSGLAFAPRQAFADHDEKGFAMVGDVAHTLRKNEWRLGLIQLEYGILDSLDIGTYHLVWLLRVANLRTKFQPYVDEHWQTALGLGVFYLDLGSFPDVDENTTATFVGIPIEAMVTYRFNDAYSLSTSIQYTALSVEGQYNEDDFQGLVGVANLQFSLTFIARLTRVTAIYVHGRVLAFQNTDGAATSTVDVDPFTQIETTATGSTDALNVEGANALSAGLLLSWKYTNIKLGLGYGEYFIPGANFVIPSRIIFPEFDLFWRF